MLAVIKYSVMKMLRSKTQNASGRRKTNKEVPSDSSSL